MGDAPNEFLEVVTNKAAIYHLMYEREGVLKGVRGMLEYRIRRHAHTVNLTGGHLWVP